MEIERPFLIGVIHLAPLPGSPGWKGDIEAVIENAVADATLYRDGGMSAVIVENFGDAPFFKTSVPPETIAAMARAGAAVSKAIGDSIPMGFNVLRNDPNAALGLCTACGGDFIRVNVHTSAMLTDQGIIEGDAAGTVRKRKTLCPQAKIFADVMVKHASPLNPEADLSQAARDTFHRGRADGLLVTGTGTGEETALNDLQTVREAVPEALILAGSGADAGNIPAILKFADGVIVGSSLKESGNPESPVDAGRVANFVSAARAES